MRGTNAFDATATKIVQHVARTVYEYEYEYERVGHFEHDLMEK